MDDKKGEGNTYNNSGNAYQSLGKYHEDIEYYEKYLHIAIDIGDKKGEGNTYGNMGDAYQSLGKYHEAIEYYEKSLNIAIDIGDKKGEGNTYGNMGDAYRLLSKYHKAIEYNKKSLHIAIEIGDKYGEGNAYGNLGNAYLSLGKHHEAIQYQDKYLHIAIDIRDKRGEGMAYGNLGNAYGSLGKYHEAIEYHEKSLHIAVEIGNKKKEGHAYNNLGGDYQLLGKYHKAIEYYEKSLHFAIEIGDKYGEGNTYNNIGYAYLSLGKYHEAIEYHEKSLHIVKDIGNKYAEGMAYGNLGNACMFLGKYHEANEYHDKYLHIAIDIGDKRGEGAAYGNLGISYQSLGENHEAIKYAEKYLPIAKDIGDKRGEGTAYANLGNAYWSLGKYHEAFKYYKKSLQIAIDISDKSTEGECLHNLGLIYHELSSSYNKGMRDAKYEEYLKESIVNLEGAMGCHEWLFEHLKDSDDFKISIVDKYIVTYKLLSTVLIESQQIEKALLVSDRGRARALGDVLISKYSMAQNVDLKCNPLQYDDIKNFLSKCDFDVMFFAIMKSKVGIWVLTQQNTHFEESQTPENKDIEVFVNEVVSAAFNKMKVREVTNCENRSLDVTQNSNVKAETIGDAEKMNVFPSESSTDVVESLDRNVVEEDLPDANEQFPNPLEMLYNVLVESSACNVKQEEVVIIPDGRISKVPFAALRDPSTGLFLSETKRIRLAPSLATLKILQEHREDLHSKTGALVIGDPDAGEVMYMGARKTFPRLPGAMSEAADISKLLNTTALTGPAATKDVVMQRLREGVAVIHIAAHGSTEGRILLAPCVQPDRKDIPEEGDYILTMADVQESGLKAQLVVLSCCHSGRGEIKAEGVMAMSRAFLVAGARAVLASLWAIDDKATLYFMNSFYTYLMMGNSASTSLQQAMKEMREDEHYSEPKYWAPFFLIGDDVTIKV